jgi:hypothetical protein
MTPNNTARIGIGLLEKLFGNTKWLFREQAVNDYGIDAQVEIVNEGEYPSGQLIAFQVKTGGSYLREQDEKSIVYRPQSKHVEYWLKHCLPVVIIVCDPENDILYWHHFTSSTTEDTGLGYKIHISKDSKLDITSFTDLKQVHRDPLYMNKLNRLILDLDWINRVASGEVVKVKFMDWVNKSLSRASITLSCESDDKIASVEIPTVYYPASSSHAIIQNYFPWADLEEDSEDPDVRDDYWSQYEDECYMGYDSEDKEALYSESFESWFSNGEDKYPDAANGETIHYSYLLTLNELGESFLKLYIFLFEESEFDCRSFQL